jgi:hypothetical protein
MGEAHPEFARRRAWDFDTTFAVARRNTEVVLALVYSRARGHLRNVDRVIAETAPRSRAVACSNNPVNSFGWLHEF